MSRTITKQQLAKRWGITPAALDQRCWRAKRKPKDSPDLPELLHPQVVGYETTPHGREALFDLDQIEVWEVAYAMTRRRVTTFGSGVPS